MRPESSARNIPARILSRMRGPVFSDRPTTGMVTLGRLVGIRTRVHRHFAGSSPSTPPVRDERSPCDPSGIEPALHTFACKAHVPVSSVGTDRPCGSSRRTGILRSGFTACTAPPVLRPHTAPVALTAYRPGGFGRRCATPSAPWLHRATVLSDHRACLNPTIVSGARASW